MFPVAASRRLGREQSGQLRLRNARREEDGPEGLRPVVRAAGARPECQDGDHVGPVAKDALLAPQPSPEGTEGLRPGKRAADRRTGTRVEHLGQQVFRRRDQTAHEVEAVPRRRGVVARQKARLERRKEPHIGHRFQALRASA